MFFLARYACCNRGTNVMGVVNHFVNGLPYNLQHVHGTDIGVKNRAYAGLKLQGVPHDYLRQKLGFNKNSQSLTLTCTSVQNGNPTTRHLRMRLSKNCLLLSYIPL